jgi:hypothetical protein
MRATDKIIAEAKRLPAAERRRVAQALLPKPRKASSPRRAPKKMSAKGPYASWLKLAGTGHSEHTNLSTDKYKHIDVSAE